MISTIPTVIAALPVVAAVLVVTATLVVPTQRDLPRGNRIRKRGLHRDRIVIRLA